MGNKTEQISPIVWGVAFAIPIVAYNIFNLTSQTYVCVAGLRTLAGLAPAADARAPPAACRCRCRCAACGWTRS